jgi:NAD(P)-dependent dehydrogenase (short-subunit alcohol dehydrogenase family)
VKPRESPGWVVVTGAATGIGRAVSEFLLERGWRVLGVGLDGTDGEELVTSAGQGADVRFAEIDVTDEPAVTEFFDGLAKQGIRVTGLVNCAGIYPPPATIEELSLADWRRVMSVNVEGIFLVCRGAVPLMKAAGGGSIVNIASVHAVAAASGQPAYAASKGAVVALTRQIAIDYAPHGIRANSVIVGSVSTRITLAAIEEAGSAEALNLTFDENAIGRIAPASEVAPIAAFLLGEESRFITASALVADGGLTSRIL